ncbi:MAG: DEAD/DEAH box helicase [Bacteroidota bacterium]
MKIRNIFNSFKAFFNELSAAPVERRLDRYYRQLDRINERGSSYALLSSAALREKLGEIRMEIHHSGISEQLVNETFALVREACHRSLGQRHYDVQVLAALVLQAGKLAEMKTGEGKTLAAVLPAVLYALEGKGVHILTFNDYLAVRDAAWMGPVYRFLGLTVAAVTEKMSPAEKKRAYACDITYATAKEVGFDYLRSNIAWEPEEIVLRPFYYAIVDEADALLIDEARNPLVLAGDQQLAGLDLAEISAQVARLSPEDYETDDYARNVFLSERGISRIEEWNGIGNLFADEHHEFLAAVNMALQARVLLKRDVDYVVKDGEVKLVDEFTGRIMKDRKWQHGLQMAVEAKEGLRVRPEGTVLASVPLHHFMRLYPRLAGMTATASESADEFMGFYRLVTVVIPPNKPCIREDLPDLIFTNRRAKMMAILGEVLRVHERGRPVLIGTLTVKESEELALFLASHGIQAVVLNALNDAEEARIIADAGAPGAVTISTNMAGRGTDILPGGSDGRMQDLVRGLGGLHVIGTNRHESLRVDNQLRGRAGRQGDPGSSRFIISFEDDLMVRYRLKSILPPPYRKMKSPMPVDDPVVQSRIAQSQRIIEGQMFEMRRTLNEYSMLIEKQRLFLLQQRDELLYGEPDASPPELKKWKLLTLDRLWAAHLDHASELKEGIHLLRLGGEDPVRNFHRKMEERFQELLSGLEDEFSRLDSQVAAGLVLPPAEKPSSTWTYLVNDNPFKNKLAINMLAGAFFGTSR